MFYVVAVAALAWVVLLCLPWQPWRMRERFEARRDQPRADLGDITVLIPARDEAGVLGTTLAALSEQGRGLEVIVIDDNSSDRTAAIARQARLSGLSVIAGAPLPAGWTGKLWALEQARAQVHTSRVLLLDADIELAPGTIAGLRDKAGPPGAGYQLVSLMAHLRMQSRAERLLMPAFIYFFKLLYPFALSNRGSRFTAAAAGGCVLLDTQTLNAIGGFASLRDAVIDDCALAARVRATGGRTWVGVTHAAVSRRGAPDLRAVHAMVARSAFTQLGYSYPLLIGCTLVMALMFWAPVVGLFAGSAPSCATALLAAAAMVLSYLPTLRYYQRDPRWALLLPVIATLYLGMTWSSAFRYWRGVRSAWRGRAYHREPGG